MELAALHVVVDEMPSQGQNTLVVVMPIVTTLIAALSAALSWRSVTYSGRVTRRSLIPVLKPAVWRRNANVVVSVGNASKTLAVSTGWAVLFGQRRAEGVLENGFLKPDETAEVRSALAIRAGLDDAAGEPTGLVWCRDVEGHVHVWSTDGRECEIEKNRARGKHPHDLLVLMFPDRARDAVDETPPQNRVAVL